MRTVYLHEGLSEEKKADEREWLKHLHRGEEIEIIETDLHGIVWMDNSLAVQQMLRETGREPLIRPLEPAEWDTVWARHCAAQERTADVRQ